MHNLLQLHRIVAQDVAVHRGLLFALAGLFGPMIMNSIYNSSGRYQPAFLVAAALAVVGEVLIVLLDRRLKAAA